jgi:hypothetical protein
MLPYGKITNAFSAFYYRRTKSFYVMTKEELINKTNTTIELIRGEKSTPKVKQ